MRSSVASSMAGFISGGREALLSSCMAATVVTIDLVYHIIGVSGFRIEQPPRNNGDSPRRWLTEIRA